MARVPFPESTARLVNTRRAGRCERCGLSTPHIAMHHRQPRGMGSSTADPHSPSNVVALCPPCHRWTHANPFQAYTTGWLVRRGYRPEDEPVSGWLGWLWLLPDGTRATDPPGPEGSG